MRMWLSRPGIGVSHSVLRIIHPYCYAERTWRGLILEVPALLSWGGSCFPTTMVR